MNSTCELNLFFLETPLDDNIFINSGRRRKKRMRWRVEHSCWKDRGPSLLETDELLAKHFGLDWEVARQSHGLEQLIVKSGERSPFKAGERPPAGENDLVYEVAQTLIRHARVINGAFDYYAEFLQCLVRIAVERSVVSGRISDVSQAVDMLLTHISSKLPPEALQNSNTFRKRYCYVEQTSKALEHHASSIEALFVRYAAAGISTALNSTTTMSIGEWL
ncbi:MAG: hypothetical protein SGPRY_007367, partial [Prymnesium sp.]